MRTLSEEHYDHWLAHGYVVAPLLEPAEVESALAEIYEYMPPWEEYKRHPRWYEHSVSVPYGPTKTDFFFPFAGSVLNLTTISENLVSFAEKILRTNRIMLSHGVLGGKYAGTREYDQLLHCDFSNNMLVVPNADEVTFDFPALIYYTDVTVDLGPTYVVPREYTQDDPLVPRDRSREEHREMYEHEFPVTVPAGHVLVYSMRTFHRGSRILAKEGVRFAQNIGFKRLDTPFCGQVTFQHDGGRHEMDRFIEAATPRQRELVGFPAAGDPYWTKEMVEAVGRRYPGMDMSPYEN